MLEEKGGFFPIEGVRAGVTTSNKMKAICML
jgi:hypothetical protein